MDKKHGCDITKGCFFLVFSFFLVHKNQSNEKVICMILGVFNNRLQTHNIARNLFFFGSCIIILTDQGPGVPARGAAA